MSDKGFAKDLRRSFFRGLTAILPTVLTLAIIMWVCVFVYKYIGKYANVAAQWFAVQFLAARRQFPITWIGPDEVWTQVKDVWADFALVWIGFVLAFIFIYIIGRFVTSFIGRSVLHMLERALLTIPIMKQVYPSVKQVTDFVFSEHKIKFSRVVLIQYPRKGIWAVGLVTSPGMKAIQTRHNDYLTVFVPSSPMPLTGYTVMMHKKDVVDLAVNVDEALKYIVSGGVLVPPGQTVDVDLGPMQVLAVADSEEQNHE